jgi:hypothetical protein
MWLFFLRFLQSGCDVEREKELEEIFEKCLYTYTIALGVILLYGSFSTQFLDSKERIPHPDPRQWFLELGSIQKYLAPILNLLEGSRRAHHRQF